MDGSKSGTMWQVIVSVALAVGLGLIGMFWSLADPRTDIKEIKNNYLSLREHDEFVRRFSSDVARIEQVNRDQSKDMARKVDIESHYQADEAIRKALDKRLDNMQYQIDLLMAKAMK